MQNFLNAAIAYEAGSLAPNDILKFFIISLFFRILSGKDFFIPFSKLLSILFFTLSSYVTGNDR